MSDTVTLSRAEYEALLDRLEDAEDSRRLDDIEARRHGRGDDGADADHLPIDLVERLCAGEHPVRVWRKHRRLTREALAALAGVAPSYVTEIEIWKKPGSFDALAKIAIALAISLDDIAVWTARKV